MELNLETKQQLEKLLDRPTSVTQTHIPLLQKINQAYPYYQLPHLLLAKAMAGSENQDTYFTKATLYSNGNTLHRTLHETKALTSARDFQIVMQKPWSGTEVSILETAEVIAPLVNSHLTNKIEETVAIDPTEHLPENTEETVYHAGITSAEPLTGDTLEAPLVPPLPAPEIENLAPLENEIIKVCEPRLPSESTLPSSNNIAEEEKDEQETFEEIGELILPTHYPEPTASEPEDSTEEEPANSDNHTFNEDTENDSSVSSIPTEQEVQQTLNKEEDKDLEIESVASVDFFAFEKNIDSDTVSEGDAPTSETPIEAAHQADIAHKNIISKYDDDKLPFTFLWWLNKTRKDYEQIFRPFASPVKNISPAQNLQQQYVEHIFHLQTPLEQMDENEPMATEHSKERELVDNFIKNEPQIKAPKPDQINNENKAKKSAEDNYDLVSETLAEIYTEQMLYHKAIDTYQKLSLKFPEKSRYFADLIQSLEKKI